MDSKQLIGLMAVLEKLKCNTRHSWTSSGRQESVAEHSWRLSLLAYFVKDAFPEADIGKIILMSLIHDVGEAFTGDIPAFHKTAADEAAEEDAVRHFVKALPVPYQTELSALFDEMASLSTQEAKIYKALDKMEVLMQHNEADIATWIPLEYELNMTYGAGEALFSDYMQNLRQQLNNDALRKIETEKGHP